MMKTFTLTLMMLFLCSCATNNAPLRSNEALLFSSGKFNKRIKMSQEIFTPIHRAELDPDGAAIAVSAVLKAKKGIELSEEAALKELFEKGDRQKMIERNGAISFQDIANVLESNGLTVKGSKTRFSSDGSYRKDSMMKMAFIGNPKTQSMLPLIAMLSFNQGKSNYFVVINAADSKYLYANDPHQGKVAITEADFLSHCPMVLFAY